MSEEEFLSRRKELRFQTCPGQTLQCETIVNDEDSYNGAVVDISPGGLRVLCDGQFQVGQSFSTELKTDRSHGAYRGVIRHVQPWVGGKSIVGCQLVDTIPDEVLGILAYEGIVNRRRDSRVDWHQPAKMSWELHSGEVDIEIHDCSSGGLKISSQKPIPDDVRLRIFVEMGEDEPMTVDAKLVWQLQQAGGYLAGLSFARREVPEAVARILARYESGKNKEIESDPSRSLGRRSVLVATAIIVFSLALWQTGVWG